MTGRREFLRTALGASAVVLLSACTSAPPSAPAQPTSVPPASKPATTPAGAAPSGGQPTQAVPAQQAGAVPATSTFRIAYTADPDSLEPAAINSIPPWQVVGYMVEPLIFLQLDGSIGPGLAERWEQSPDGKTFTFTLRKGVKFHDGADVDAQAVKLSLDRILNPNMKAPFRAGFDQTTVDSVSAVDPGTVRIQLKNTFGPFLYTMTSPVTGIVSPNHARNFAESYNEEPVGTGPYKFKERRKGESITFDRFDGYWGQKPAFASQQFRIAPDAATRESLLLANQVDAIVVPPLSDIPALQRNNNVKVLIENVNRCLFINMDQTVPGTPLTDRRIRQALNYAVDKESIIKSILFGTGVVADAPMAPTVFGYAKTGPYPYDPNRAKQLLQEAGQPNLSLKLAHPTGRYPGDVPASQAIAGNLRDVGVETEISTSDWPSYLATVNVPEGKGTAHLHMWGWSPSYPDAYQTMLMFTRTQWPPNGLGMNHYTHPRVEELLDQAAREINQDKRKELYAEAQKIVWDEAAAIFLWVQRWPVVHSSKVKNVHVVPTEVIDTVYAEPA
jgi:peptide/nickel transport system substrate-binding protein